MYDILSCILKLQNLSFFKLKCIDTYGDGGVKGNVKNLLNNKSIVNFNFNNGSSNRLNFSIKN